MRYRLRTLLLLTALVAVVVAGWSAHYRRLDRLARLHSRQAVRLAEHRAFLNSVSFHVPPEAWLDLDQQERSHLQLASEYRRQIWRPWLRPHLPESPLPLLIEATSDL